MVNMCKHKGRSPKRYIVRSEWKVSLWDCLHIYGRRWRAQFLQHGLAQGTGADGKYCGVTRKVGLPASRGHVVKLLRG